MAHAQLWTRRKFDEQIIPAVASVAAARTGSETVTYVAYINTYYMTYTDFYKDNLQRQLEIKFLESAPEK